jgi:hypothetical protein
MLYTLSQVREVLSWKETNCGPSQKRRMELQEKTVNKI